MSVLSVALSHHTGLHHTHAHRPVGCVLHCNQWDMHESDHNVLRAFDL